MMGSTPAPTPTPTSVTLLHNGTAPAGALTTVFTPPASCTETPSLYYRTPSCMPSPDSWGAYWDAASYYSPAICPSGMVSAATPPAGFGPPVESGETAIVCCPPRYTFYASADQHWCYGPRTTTTTTTTTPTDSLASAAATVTPSPNSVYPIQVRWQHSDLPHLETNPLMAKATATVGNLGYQNITADAQGGTDDLSGGAIAGIIIAVIIAGILLGLVGGVMLPWYVHLRAAQKREQKQARQQQQQQQQNTDRAPTRQDEDDFTGVSVGSSSPITSWRPYNQSPIGSDSTRIPPAGGTTWYATTGDEEMDQKIQRAALGHSHGRQPQDGGVEEVGLQHVAPRPQGYDEEVFHRPWRLTILREDNNDGVQ